MAIGTDEWILFSTFVIIYIIFLIYDLFKRGEPYGQFAYLAALIPTNYLWYIVTKNDVLDFGPMGAMMILGIMWLINVIRDIFIKDKSKGYKDADDVALMLIIGLVIQFILSAVLPGIPGLEVMKNGCGDPTWRYFYLPEFIAGRPGAAAASVILGYKLIATILTVILIVPIVLDLRGSPVNIVVLIIITALFAIPFAFIAFLWLPDGIGVLLLLISVLFFVLLLLLTKGEKQK